MFDTPVTDIMLVVVDPDHARYGQTASLEVHDWRESGSMYATFPDGGRADLHDGMMSDDPLLPQAMRILKSNHRAQQALRQTLGNVQPALLEIAKIARNTNLPRDLRMAAKKSFKDMLAELLKVELIQ